MAIKFTGGIKPLKRTGIALRAPAAIVVKFDTAAGVLGLVDVGVAGSAVVSAKGIDATVASVTYPATYTVSSGALPPGYSLNPTTGAITGISTVAGTYTFSITASAKSGSATQNFSITIRPVTIAWNTPISLGTMTGGDPFSTTFSASASNAGAVTYSLLSGSLPSGLTFVNGAISGTLDNVSAISTFTVRATYADVVTSDRTFTLAVSAGTVTWNTLADLGVLLAGHSLPPFSATASSGSTLTYSLISGALPSGISLGMAGTATGRAANVIGTSNFTIRAAQNALVYADRTFSVTLDQDVLTWITPTTAFASLAGGDVVAFGLQATSDNGETVSFALQGGALPAGLTLTNGSITGSVQNLTASFSFTIRASDLAGFIDRTFTGNVVGDVITWATAPNLGTVNLNAAFGTTLQATSSAGKTVSFALQSGTLPVGFALASTGTLTGSATGAAGTQIFTVRASDGVTFADQTFSLTVNGGPTWVTPAGSVATTALDQSFSTALAARSDNGVTYTILPASGGA